MPAQTKSQSIGRIGERWFQQALPSTWILQPPLDDVSVDGVVVICEDSFLNGLEFRVQIKSSETWRIRDGSVIQPGFRRENLRYLLTGFTPTLLVLYEVSNDRGVCAWINHLVYEDFKLLRGDTSTVSLRVPLKRSVRNDTWRHIGQELHGLTATIGRHVSTAGKALPVIHFLNRMSQVLEHFDFAANATKQDGNMAIEDECILSQLELSCHRDVVLAVRKLEENLGDSGVKVEGLADFAEEYVQRCSSFIREFEDVVNEPNKIQEVQIEAQQLRERRQGFVRSVISVMRQVSELGLGLAKDHDGSENTTNS